MSKVDWGVLFLVWSAVMFYIGLRAGIWTFIKGLSPREKSILKSMIANRQRAQKAGRKW